MTVSLAPTQSDILTALRSFLLGVLPPNTEVLLSQANQVAEPEGLDFVLMTPTTRLRLGTNVDMLDDCAFTASVAGNVMTVTAAPSLGVILPGATLLGANITQNPTIMAQTSGTTGGVGTYTISAPQLPISSQVMATGVLGAEQDTQVTIQLDVHGPASADNAQMISTLLRDEYAVDQFPDNIKPMYADTPHQVPFVNDQSQWETRWIVEVQLQANQTVSVPQQFADVITVGLVSVEEAYPAS